MSKLKVYLSGATKHVDEKFQNWRERCFDWQKSGYWNDINFIDPISYFNYTNKQPNTDRQCLDLFMWQIEKCDVLLINLDYSDTSCGSMAEVEHAYCFGKPIIGFGSKPETWYSWAKERASVIFKTPIDAVEYINSSYGSI